MSSREPLWYCHECNAEMYPLMTPDPICASCRGSFVEKLEDPTDDPREFQRRSPNMFDINSDLPGAFEGLLRSSDPWGTGDDPSARYSSSRPRSNSPPTQRTRVTSPPGSGFHFEFHSGPGGASTRTFVLGGPNTLGHSTPQSDRPIPSMFDFLRDRENPNNMRNGDITGPLMAQYLLALFGREPNGRGDPFAELLGMPSSTRWGDYVFNQEALDQILTQLAENSTVGRPVPASEDIIDNLPREVLAKGSPLLERDCAVCKESFRSDPEDSDELVVVTLPCKHSFHESCIVPWLKSSGTCPVCRFALVAQPQQHSPPGGSSGGGSGSDRSNSSPNSSSGSRWRSPGNSDRGRGGGIFQSLFGGGTSGGSSDRYSTRSRPSNGRGNRNNRSEAVPYSPPPFPGHWIEDID